MASPRSATGRYDRDQLVAVALEEFRRRGYDATSMDQLARAAGLSKAAIYHHVSGKEELLEIGITRALDALEAVLDEPQATRGPAVDRLRHVLRRVVELEVALLSEVTVLLRCRGNSDIERQAVERRRAFDRAIAALIGRAQHEGDIRPGVDPGLAARLAVGTATWVVEWYQPGGRLGPTELADAVVGTVLDGLTERPTPDRAPDPAPRGPRSRPTRARRAASGPTAPRRRR
jgi:AcrR family transcriptional regulator